MNRIRRLTPVSPFDVPGVESWLQDMAARGLRLIRFRPLFCTFERCEPEQRRYRVEVCRQAFSGEVPAPMRDLYGEFGWEYADTLSDGMLLFSTTDPDAPEPHSDPRLQAEAWTKVRRSRALSCLATLLICLVVLGAGLFSVWRIGLLQVMVLHSGVLFVLVPLFLLLNFPGECLDLHRLNRIVRQLREGIPLSHRTVWPRRNPGTLLSFSCAVALLVCSLAIALHLPPFQIRDMEPLDTLTAFDPLTLEELGTRPVTVQGRDYGNFVRQGAPAPLCWNSWEVVQTGVNTPQLWERLEIRWYELPFSALSVPLARELFDTSRRLDADIWWRAEEPVSWTADWPDPGEADFLALARTREGNFQVACAASGRRVAVVRWTGAEDLSRHLDGIIRMVRGG